MTKVVLDCGEKQNHDGRSNCAACATLEAEHGIERTYRRGCRCERCRAVRSEIERVRYWTNKGDDELPAKRAETAAPVDWSDVAHIRVGINRQK